MEKNPYIEFREDDEADGGSGLIKVYFLGVHVQTIRETNTRPGGWTYTDKEQAVRRAERAVAALWEQAGEIL